MQYVKCTEVLDSEDRTVLRGAFESVADAQPLLDRFEQRLRELSGFVRRELGIAHFAMAGCDLAVVGFSPTAPVLEFDRRGPSGPRRIGFVYTISLEGEVDTGVHGDASAGTGVSVKLFESETRDGRDVAGTACTEVAVEDNSVVLFPGDRHVEFRGVDLEDAKVDRITIMGSIVGADSLRSARRVGEGKQRELRERFLPRFTDAGFEVRPTPPEFQRLVTSILAMRSIDRPVDQLSSDVLDITSYRHDLHRGIRSSFEQFAGVSLVASGFAGMYLHREGHRIDAHFGGVDTEVVSAVIQIAQAPDVTWPFVLERDDRSQQVDLHSGQMLLFEAATVSRARPIPLMGKWCVTMMVHFRPLDWEWNEELLIDRGVAGGQIEGVERRPIR